MFAKPLAVVARSTGDVAIPSLLPTARVAAMRVRTLAEPVKQPYSERIETHWDTALLMDIWSGPHFPVVPVQTRSRLVAARCGSFVNHKWQPVKDAISRRACALACTCSRCRAIWVLWRQIYSPAVQLARLRFLPSSLPFPAGRRRDTSGGCIHTMVVFCPSATATATSYAASFTSAQRVSRAAVRQSRYRVLALCPA